MASLKRHPLWLLAGFWIGIAISLAVVARRLVALAYPSETGRAPNLELDAVFASHARLTIAHIVPAAVFVLLAAWVLFRSPRPQWISAAFFGSGALTGLTAYAMSVYAIGGWVERAAVLVFNTWFLYSLWQAYRLHRRMEPWNERRWTTRAVGILLGIATTRPVMGVFFATSPLTHLQPKQFFGIAFWIGFSINMAVIELWLHSGRRGQLQAPDLQQTALRTSS